MKAIDDGGPPVTLPEPPVVVPTLPPSGGGSYSQFPTYYFPTGLNGPIIVTPAQPWPPYVPWQNIVGPGSSNYYLGTGTYYQWGGRTITAQIGGTYSLLPGDVLHIPPGGKINSFSGATLIESNGSRNCIACRAGRSHHF